MHLPAGAKVRLTPICPPPTSPASQGPSFCHQHSGFTEFPGAPHTAILFRVSVPFLVLFPLPQTLLSSISFIISFMMHTQLT